MSGWRTTPQLAGRFWSFECNRGISPTVLIPHGIPASLRRCRRVSRRCSLVRVVEEELIAVGIIDHQEPVAPRTLLDRNALGLEFRMQRIQRGDRGLARL